MLCLSKVDSSRVAAWVDVSNRDTQITLVPSVENQCPMFFGHGALLLKSKLVCSVRSLLPIRHFYLFAA